MEDRGGAHRVMQRRLEDPPVEATPEEVEEAPEQSAGKTEPPRTVEPLTLPPSRGPSDSALRERQRAWQQERARFEANKRRRPAVDEGSNSTE
jgi:hypothetical protein